MRTGLVIAVVAGLLGWAGPAMGEDEEIVGVLNLDTQGVSPTAAEVFESGIEEGLAGIGFRVSPRSRLRSMLEQSSYIDGCLFGPCLKEVYRNTKVKLVLVARIVGLGANFSFVVSLLDTRTGLTVSQVASMCDVCTLEEAIATATLAVIELVTAAAQSPEGKVAADAAEAVASEPEPADERRNKNRRMVRRAAIFFISAAAIAGGGAAYLLGKDDKANGYAVAAAGGTMAVVGGTFLVISGRF